MVLSSDHDLQVLQSVANEHTIRAPIALAREELRKLFNHSEHAPERAHSRVEYVEPSYVILDASGRVAHRDWGIQESDMAAALDSLLVVASW